MINTDNTPGTTIETEAAVDAIVRSGAGGAIMLAGLSTAIVIGLWLAFYLLVFSPRAGGA